MMMPEEAVAVLEQIPDDKDVQRENSRDHARRPMHQFKQFNGYTAEMSPITHPKLIATLERAAKIVNDPVIGFDVISTDVTADPDNTRWGIIEANSLPFINLHYEPLEGPSIDIAPYVWDLWK